MKSKKLYINLLVILTFLLGITIMGYPFFSNWYNQILQNRLITEYNTSIDTFSPEAREAELNESRQYNQKLIQNVMLTDPFDHQAEKSASEEYLKRLNIDHTNIMGYLTIPKINVKLSIYHGTTPDILDKGVGHLEKTSLPVGGTGTHAVLSAHSAYAEATLFNNLIDLKKNDHFYLNILGENLAYRVDQIKVVSPSNTKDLAINRNEDYVTLVTCTPHGINSHRLLVRGTRVPYIEENVETAPGINWKPYVILVTLILTALSLYRKIKKLRSQQ